jgi:hypothetical protein
VDLVRTYSRLEHVLENSLYDDAIDAAVRQGDCVAARWSSPRSSGAFGPQQPAPWYCGGV